ncbi:hypothetical protein Dimus_002014, partial [Dionaea muscipula]
NQMEAEREMKVRGRKEEGGERPCALEFADFAAVLERGVFAASEGAREMKVAAVLFCWRSREVKVRGRKETREIEKKIRD